MTIDQRCHLGQYRQYLSLSLVDQDENCLPPLPQEMLSELYSSHHNLGVWHD
jgi:hypothetical protein